MNVKVNKKSVQKYEGIKNVTSFDISDSFKILRERYFSIGIRIFQSQPYLSRHLYARITATQLAYTFIEFETAYHSMTSKHSTNSQVLHR